MSRFARDHRVFYFEEPVFEDAGPLLRVNVCPTTHIHVCTPVLPQGLSAAAAALKQRELLDAFLIEKAIRQYVAWYYTPMARDFSRHLEPLLTVYDCMDELSAFAGAPPSLSLNEKELFEAADLVFTGGASLFESKRKHHTAVHLYPSSVDLEHFASARELHQEPQDQRSIPYPRLGYAGVIDERMDIDLLDGIARLRPDWQFVMLGPVVKIDPAILPANRNIHYLGMKPYADLPAYFSGWRIGMLPFALNESTRYISPTKTPEYLAAGLSVISTPIADVVKPYGELGLASIVRNAEEFIGAAERIFGSAATERANPKADAFLARNSWDKTWRCMDEDISAAITKKQFKREAANLAFVGTPATAKGAAHV